MGAGRGGEQQSREVGLVAVPRSLGSGRVGGRELSGSARSLGGVRSGEKLDSQTFELRDSAGGLPLQTSCRLLCRSFRKDSLTCVLSL